MVKQAARPRTQESVGTRITRRTVTRGIAWSTPVVAVASAAPAFAASPVCTPIITIDQQASCRCPGQSVGSQEFTYFLKFCVVDNSACPVPPGTDPAFVITKVEQHGNKILSFDPNDCFSAGGTGTTPAVPGGTLGGCTDILRFEGGSSGIKLFVSFTVGGVPFGPVELSAPVNCSGTTATLRCSPCADNTLPNSP